ncbi:hypothetical protein OG747_03005 [Streptomyces sp. NBC_01384]|uniref:hypothetical protein n=1 Tax=Streptomyces sp. NBC_01384 TaxID=2903847 RepID=UPI00325622A1
MIGDRGCDPGGFRSADRLTPCGDASNGRPRRSISTTSCQIYRTRLGLAPGAHLQQLVDAIAAHNQRTITMEERDLAPVFSRLCLRGPEEDRIIVSRDNTDWQRWRVKVHELGHLLPWIDPASDDCMVSGHGQGHGIDLDHEALTDQLATLPSDLVQDILNPNQSIKQRARFDTGSELAAEAWATAVSRLLAPGGGTDHPTDAIRSAFSNRSW